MIFSQIRHGLLPYEFTSYLLIHLFTESATYTPITHPPTYLLFTYIPIPSHLHAYIPIYIFHFYITYLFAYPPTNILFIFLSTHLPI
jgi:hypothetical protein